MKSKTTEAPKTLDQVSPLLGWAYSEWKKFEETKNEYRDIFFDLATEAIKRDGLGLRLYKVTADSEVQAKERAERHNPGWLIDELRPHRVTKGLYEVILGEDPTLKPFEFEHEGTRYARQVRKGAVMVDDEWLHAEDPELYEAVTYQLPWGDRITVPVEHLDKKKLGALSKYIYNSPPSVSLAPPRPVKEDR